MNNLFCPYVQSGEIKIKNKDFPVVVGSTFCMECKDFISKMDGNNSLLSYVNCKRENIEDNLKLILEGVS